MFHTRRAWCLIPNLLVWGIWRCMGFWFNRVIQQRVEITMRTQYSNCNTQLDHNTNKLPITSWRQLKPVALFGVHFVGWLIFRLFVGLSHKYTLPMLVWLAGEDNINYFREGHLHNQLTHSTATAVYLKQRPPSSPLCVETSSASFMTAVVTSYMLFWVSWAHHPCLPSLSLLPLKWFVGQPQQSSRLPSRQWFHPWNGQMSSYVNQSC